MNVLGIIPARGGSKGIKDKNILDVFGKPLVGYTIEAALRAKRLDKVVVSTDSEKIAEVVRDIYGIYVVKRPPELAQDDSPIEEAMLHAVKYLEKENGFKADIVVLMQANVPMRKEGIIDDVIEKLIGSDADSCVTCHEVDQIPEVMKLMNEKKRLIPMFKDVTGIRRQEFPKRYLLDGSVVALRVENLFKTRGIRKAHIFLGEEIIPLIQEKKMYSLELDVFEDVLLAEYYLKQINCGVDDTHIRPGIY